MPEKTTLLRLYLLRALYLLNFALLGLDVWPALVTYGATWDPVRGVAFAFWCALSLVSALGLRHPLRMVPVLLLQFAYKLIWIVGVAVPQWGAVAPTELANSMLVGVVIDLVVIPWPYLWRQYVAAPGDRWRPVRGSVGET